MCRGAIEGLPNDVKSGKSLPEVIRELLEQECTGGTCAEQCRSKQVGFLRQAGGEGSFRSASGDVNLRGGSELREGGKDLAGPVVGGKGVGDCARNKGRPGERRVEPPLVEPAYELMEKRVAKGGFVGGNWG